MALKASLVAVTPSPYAVCSCMRCESGGVRWIGSVGYCQAGRAVVKETWRRKRGNGRTRYWCSVCYAQVQAHREAWRKRGGSVAKKRQVFVVEARPVGKPTGDWFCLGTRLNHGDALKFAEDARVWRKQNAKEVRVVRYVPEEE